MKGNYTCIPSEYKSTQEKYTNEIENQVSHPLDLKCKHTHPKSFEVLDILWQFGFNNGQSDAIWKIYQSKSKSPNSSVICPPQGWHRILTQFPTQNSPKR